MNNFINWNELSFKKDKGKEKIRCPACDDQRSDKKDKSLLINHNEGYGKCFYCESLTFRDDNNNTVEKNYPNLANKAINSVFNEEKIIKYINTRKIEKSVLNSLYVTFEKHYQPSKGKEVDNIVFNYYEGSKLVNKKYRSADKKFTQTTGGKPIFYNINSVIGQKEVYIVEGEFDVLAMRQQGIKNCISVPNGANDNDEYWKNSEKYLKDVKSFIIAVDNDEKGNILKDKIAQRLGRYRCKYLEFKNKDANGDLIEGCLNETLKNKLRFPVNGTFTANDLKGGIYDLYENGLPETLKPKSYYFKGLKNIFSVMRGQLTTVTGIPSHGKSNVTDWYVLNLIKDYDMKCSWFSPEHSPMQLYKTSIIEKVIGKPFWKNKKSVNGTEVQRITKNDIEKYIEWANERIYLTGCDDELPTWNWLLDKFKEQMFTFGIDIFVIDAFNKLILSKGNRLEQINIVLTKLTHFAQANNVLIFLIAHPTKMQKDEKGVYSVPTLYDVSGSSDFRNQTHNGFTVHRNFDEDYSSFYNMKTKFSFQGEMMKKIDFKYSHVNSRLYEVGTEEPLFSLIDQLDQKQDIDFSKENLNNWIEQEPESLYNDAFGNDEKEIPF